MITLINLRMLTLLALILMMLVFALPTLLALIDIIRNRFTENYKILLLLIVLLFNGIGALLYFILGAKHKLPKEANTDA